MTTTATRTVADLMTRDPVSVRGDTSLGEAAQLLEANHISGLPVVDAEGALIGVLSQTDLVRVRATQHLWSNWPGLAVRHLMSSPALTVSASASLEEVAQTLEQRHVHRLVVLADDGRTPIGIISTSDLIRAMARGEADA